MNARQITGIVLSLMMLTSVFAFAGVAVADNGDDRDATLEDGEVYWEGQILEYNTELDEEDTANLYDGDEDFVTQLAVDDDGYVEIDTEDLSGDYKLEYNADDESDSDGEVEFEIQVHELELDAETDSVTNTAGDASDLTVEFDSNRVDYDVIVDVDGLEDDDVDEGDVEGIFADLDDDAEFDDEEGTVTLEGLGFDEYTLDFEGVEADDYEFAFQTTDSAASDEVEVTVEEPGDAFVEFEDSIYEGERGELVEMEIEFDNTDTAYVEIGDYDDIAYESHVTVELDEDASDDTATLQFNPHYAGHYDQGDVEEEDIVTVEDGTVTEYSEVEDGIPEEFRLVAGQYDLSVGTDDDTMTDVASLYLSERSTDDVTTYTAPADATISDVEDIKEYSTDADTIAEDDHLIVHVEASGLDGWLTEDTYDEYINSGDDSEFTLVTEVDADIPNFAPDPVEETGEFIEADDGFYLVYDVEDDFEDLEPEAGDEFTTEFVETEYSDYVEDEDDKVTLNTTFEYVELEAEYDNLDDEDVIHVEGDEDGTVTITGETTAAPGTELSFTLESMDGDSPFLKSADAEVDDDRTFEVAVDFSEVAEDTQFTVDERNILDEHEAVYEAAADEYDLDVEVVDVEGDEIENATVLIDGEELDLPAALEAGEYEVEADADNYESGTETVEVDDDETVTVELEEEEEEPEPEEYTLDIQVENEDGDAVDATVTVNGESGDAPASFTLEEGDYTVEVTPDDEYEGATETVTLDGDESVTIDVEEDDESEGEGEGDDDEGEGDDDSVPGFGIVAALIAMLVAAGIAGLKRLN